MVTLFHLVFAALVAVVVVGILKTLHQIRLLTRAAQDPEELAQRIRAAFEAAGGDVDGARIEVKIGSVPRQPFSQQLLAARPEPIDTLAISGSTQRGRWLLAFGIALVVAWAFTRLI